MTRLQAGWTQRTDAGLWVGRGYGGTGDSVRASIPTLASTGADAIGTTNSGQLAYSAPGSGLQMWTPAFIAAEAMLRGTLRGLYVPLNPWSGVAIGTDIVNPPGITGTITTLRHNAFTNNRAERYIGDIAANLGIDAASINNMLETIGITDHINKRIQDRINGEYHHEQV